MLFLELSKKIIVGRQRDSYNKRKMSLSTAIILKNRGENNLASFARWSVRVLSNELFRRYYDSTNKFFIGIPSFAILLCLWERHFAVLFPAWRSCQAVQNFIHISIKFPADSNILISPETSWGNYLRDPTVDRTTLDRTTLDRNDI